jgi:hypothetical protein
VNQQGYSQQQPQPKKGMSGCAIAAIVVGGLGLVVMMVVGVFCYKAAKMVGEVASEGINAPGAAELRSAGCDVGMVMDPLKVMGSFGVDAGTASGGSPLVVSCTVNAGKSAPTCDDIAKVYVKAVTRAPRSFMGQVQVQGKTKPDCQKIYDETGKYIKDV